MLHYIVRISISNLYLTIFRLNISKKECLLFIYSFACLFVYLLFRPNEAFILDISKINVIYVCIYLFNANKAFRLSILKTIIYLFFYNLVQMKLLDSTFQK